MPFTFSHPAIILPLHKLFKNYVSLTGLIIGSLTPDFEYFLRMRIKSEYSHTLIGNIWLNLPLGIVLCFLFHIIIKKPLIDNSPSPIQKRLVSFRKFGWTNYFKNRWFIVCISLIIGSYSHILWDSFTHHDAYFVNLLNLDRDFFRGIPIFKILQHLSSLIGAFIILFYFYSIKPVEIKIQKPKLNYWIKIVLLALLIVTIRFVFGLKITEYGNVIVSCITSFMVSLTVISMIEKSNDLDEIENGNNILKD